MIQLKQLDKSFNDKTILADVNYQFPQQKRIGLIGANGAGKTTLLNIICGLEEPDAGEVYIPGMFKMGYLPQEPNPNPKKSVIDEAQAGQSQLLEIKDRLQKSMETLSVQHSDQALADYEELETSFKSLGGYSLEAKSKGILAGLGFSEQQCSDSPKNLSGGWRMRLELAKIFINEPDFLVLDEPTNHLDLPSLVWVENYLKNFKGTVLFVSHDRSLLNRLGNHTLLLSHGQLESYPCNFDEALEQRAQRLEQDEATKENLAKKREKMERFVERFGAKATKAKQAQSRVKMIAKLRDMEDELKTDTGQGEVSFSLPSPPKSGRVVLEVDSLDIGYSSSLAQNINLNIERGQKIAIIGANGIGKSTFLKTITGLIPELAGKSTLGHQVEPAYFSQNHDETLDLDKNCLENVLSASADIGEKEARSVLGAFLFTGDDVFKEVRVLSGGEKSRVALAKILVQRSNFLMLDEPTNHLDMSSVESLIDAVNQFEGTLLFVSHDRNFIDSVCSHVFVMLPSGRSMLFEGKLDDYQRLAKIQNFPNVLDIDGEKLDAAPEQEDKQGHSKASHEEVRLIKKRRNSLSKKLTTLEENDSKLKKERSDLEHSMIQIDPSDFQSLNDVQEKLSSIDEQLSAWEMEWLELSEELEGVENELKSLGRS